MHEIQLSKYELQFYKNNNHLYKGEIEIRKWCENQFQRYEIYFSFNINVWKTNIYKQKDIKIQVIRETRFNLPSNPPVTSLMDKTISTYEFLMPSDVNSLRYLMRCSAIPIFPTCCVVSTLVHWCYDADSL